MLDFNAVAHLADLLDLVAADFFDLADVQKAGVHTGFGELAAQDVVDLVDLKIAVANRGDFLVLELDRGRGALEVKPGADLFGRVFDGVFDLDQVRFQHGVKRRHGVLVFLEIAGATISGC